MTSNTTPAPAPGSVANLRVIEVRPEFVIFEVPGTEYRLHLATTSPLGGREAKRVHGEIHAKALRMHRSDTGGRFIEPIYGQPRIVQGEVLAVDVAGRRVLMDMAVPVWVSVQPAQDLDAIQPGELWNCYVESGTRFEPR
jgi:hypothetical protein